MSPADAAKFDDATSAIRLENLRGLGGGKANEADGCVLRISRREFNAERAEGFLAVFDRLVSECAGGIAGCGGVPTGVRAMQLSELAYRLLPVARWKAVGLFRRARVLDPEVTRHLPWARVAALFVLGENARRMMRAVTGAR